MARGKKAKIDRPIAHKAYVPESVSNQVYMHLINPLTGKIAHGAFSGLVTKLLREWLDTQYSNRLAKMNQAQIQAAVTGQAIISGDEIPQNTGPIKQEPTNES